jgi:preprotein translocase subunit SecA
MLDVPLDLRDTNWMHKTGEEVKTWVNSRPVLINTVYCQVTTCFSMALNKQGPPNSSLNALTHQDNAH